MPIYTYNARLQKWLNKHLNLEQFEPCISKVQINYTKLIQYRGIWENIYLFILFGAGADKCVTVVRCALVSKQCKVLVLVQILAGCSAGCSGAQSIEKTSVSSSASQANMLMM